MKEKIKQKLINQGWQEDSWGNLKKDNERIKFQKTSVRYERGARMYDNSLRWINIRSDYYKYIEVNNDGVFIKGRKVE